MAGVLLIVQQIDAPHLLIVGGVNAQRVGNNFYTIIWRQNVVRLGRLLTVDMSSTANPAKADVPILESDAFSSVLKVPNFQSSDTRALVKVASPLARHISVSPRQGIRDAFQLIPSLDRILTETLRLWNARGRPRACCAALIRLRRNRCI